MGKFLELIEKPTQLNTLVVVFKKMSSHFTDLGMGMA